MKTKYLDNFSAGHNSVLDPSLIPPGAGTRVENLYLDGRKLVSAKRPQLDEAIGGYLVPYWFRGDLIRRRFPDYTQTVFDINKLYFTENNTAKFDFHASDGTVTTHELILENPVDFCVSGVKYQYSKCSSGLEQQLASLTTTFAKLDTTTPVIKYAAIVDTKSNGSPEETNFDTGSHNFTFSPKLGTITVIDLIVDEIIVRRDVVPYDARIDASAVAEAEKAMFYNEFACSALAIGPHDAYVRVSAPAFFYETAKYHFEINPGALAYYTPQASRVFSAPLETLDPNDKVTFDLPQDGNNFETLTVLVEGRALPYEIVGATVKIKYEDIRKIVPYTTADDRAKIAGLKIDILTRLDSHFAPLTPLEYYIILGSVNGLVKPTTAQSDDVPDMSVSLGIASEVSTVSQNLDTALIGAAIAFTSDTVTGRFENPVLDPAIRQITDYTYQSYYITDAADTKVAVFIANHRTDVLWNDSEITLMALAQVPLSFIGLNSNTDYNIVLSQNRRIGQDTVNKDNYTALGVTDFRHQDWVKDTGNNSTYVAGYLNTPTQFNVSNSLDIEQKAKIFNLTTGPSSQTSEEQEKNLLASAGKLSYAVTVQDPITTVQSAPTYVLEFTSYEREAKLELEHIPNGKDVLIFRRGAFQNSDTPNAVFLLVTKLAWNGSSSRDFTDDIKTTQLGYAISTENTLKTQANINFNLVSKDKERLFLSAENKVWFSDAGVFTRIKNLSNISMSAEVTGMIATTYGQVIFTRAGEIHNIRFVNSIPVVEQLAANIPLLHDSTIAIVNDNVFFLSYEGIMLLRRTNVVNITKNIVHQDEFSVSQNPADYSAAVLYNTYYLAEHATGKLWSLDLDNNNRVIVHTDLSNTKNIVAIAGRLYESRANALYKLFESNDKKELWFRSGNLVSPYYDIEKEFVDIKYVFKGSFTVNVYIDDELVNTVDILSANLIAERFYFDTTKNKGIELSVEFIGTGEIKSIRVNFEEVTNG